MIDAVKDYLTPKTFSILAYVCLIIHCLCGVVFTGIAVTLKEGEAGKFTCNVAPQSTATYKMQVDKACYSRYQQNYNSPLPFYGFVILSIWFPILVAVIYSLCVRRRVEEIDSNTNELQSQADNEVGNKGTLYVSYFYFFHVAIRVLSGILFTILQYTVLFPSGFDFEFSCSLPPTGFTLKLANNASDGLLNRTSITCENSSAFEKQLWWVIVSVLNAGFASIMFGELTRLCRRSRNRCWSSDTEFIMVYLLGKQYLHIQLKRTNLQECIDFYQRQVLEPSRTSNVIYGPKTSLEQLYINLVIHTERAKHKFSKSMRRHEIFNVYMEVPQHSICLGEVKDLFYPNKDTDGDYPRKILVVGRPGIGKTVLTEKIMRDWASGIDECYCGKIALYFKFRLFNLTEFKDISLKTFLRYGTGLSDEKFETIYEHITKWPERAIVIFDGLDEFNGNMECFDNLPPPNDPNVSMSGISLFIKLISGHLLQGATVLVTSRPTANEFYSRVNFDRTVEIIGFTSDKIEEYVSRFCDNNNRNDLKANVWNHIKSSSDLLNLCYIPVNCFIVSTVLLECLSDCRNETSALPTTLTELYHAAVVHFDKHHYRQLDGQSFEDAIKKLELLAFNGIVHGQLVFNNELFDEQMKKSGLLNSLSNPIFPVETQFCFIHLTIQEFLAARHVIETFSPEEIKKFIFSHIESGQWHLVLQFIAGLLGKKIKMFKKNDYNDCVLAFTHRVIVKDGKIDFYRDYSLLFVMKCIREVDDEDVVREACETTVMNDVVSISNCRTIMAVTALTSTDWAAVTFVCKHMKKLTELNLYLSSHLSEEGYLQVSNLLQQRCVKHLRLMGRGFSSEYLEGECLFKALMKSQCTLNHEHSKITELDLRHFHITNECLSIMCEFFKNRHASCLERLTLHSCGITSREISKLCELLDIMPYPEFTYLDLSANEILDEGVRVLFNALKHNHLKLTHLYLDKCLVSDDCIPSLCVLLKDEHCTLTVLSMEDNEGISDEGLRMLCESALTEEHCKLAELHLFKCSLTDECISELLKALQDEHCGLNKLTLTGNKFTEKGKKTLRDIEKHKHCQARGLQFEFGML